MRKLVIALLMPMLIIGLTGCEDEGGFVNKEETIQVSIMTWDFNRNPTSTVAANTASPPERPSLSELYTLHVAVSVWNSDGSPADDGTIVNISFDPSGYGSLSRASGQEGDDEEYDYFRNCDTTSCYYMLSHSGRVTSGMAQFFFTSNDLTCPAADQPCVNLRASVKDPVTRKEVYATKPIVVW